MQTNELAGRVAIVTGAAMGIGRACAVALARAGAAVVVADVDADAGTATARQRAAVEAFGGIDILVNNAARAIGGVVDEIDEATWDTVISTNLTSVWRGMRVCVPVMRARGKGSVVNISSVQALAGFRGWAAYAAAKGGINSLTQQAAIDLAPHQIRVNAVAPGTIMTPLNERIFA